MLEPDNQHSIHPGPGRSTAPNLTAFCRLDELGLEVVGQRVEPGRAVLACRVVESDQWCRRCGSEGQARDSALGFRNLTNYIARSLLEIGGFKPHLHPRLG